MSLFHLLVMIILFLSKCTAKQEESGAEEIFPLLRVEIIHPVEFLGDLPYKLLCILCRKYLITDQHSLSTYLPRCTLLTSPAQFYLSTGIATSCDQNPLDKFKTPNINETYY